MTIYQSRAREKFSLRRNSIAYALGKNRNSWYKNFMKYIKTMNEEINPKVGKTLLLPKELFNHKHMNEYEPFAINPS